MAEPAEPVDILCSAASPHCRRVAVWAVEVARRLGVPAVEEKVLEKAALWHPAEERLLRSPRVEALLQEARIPHSGPPAEVACGPKVEAVLRAFADPKRGGDQSLAEILRFADLFDEQLEYLPYEPKSLSRICSELEVLADTPRARSIVQALAQLRQVTQQDFLRALARLPVYPKIARQALALALEEDTSVLRLQKVFNSDQVLAGHLIQAANSSFYSPSERICSIRHAISYVGTQTARKILLASAMRPLFAASGLHGFWAHSLEAAQHSEWIAREGGCVRPEEAFLAGLIHDVGRLALLMLPATFHKRYQQLLAAGCEPVAAEQVLCGFEHGEAGAKTLDRWAFPERLVDAVRHHHQPERTESVLASMLFLAEFLSSSEEDPPSRARLHGACEKVGVSPDLLLEPSQEESSPLASLVDSA